MRDPELIALTRETHLHIGPPSAAGKSMICPSAQVLSPAVLDMVRKALGE